MKTFELKGEIREDFGKKASAGLRSKGLIPCVVYGGKDTENINFTVKSGDVLKLIYTPEVFLINLMIGEKEMKAVLKEVQFHPVKEQILHMDFLQVFDDVPVVVEIPVNLEGLAAGVKAGGKLYLDIRKLRSRALYKHLPDKLTIDVTNLVLGKSIQVGDLDFENIELLNPKDAVVCRVQTTRMILDPVLEAEEEAAEEAAEEAEEAKAEGEEGAEGGDEAGADSAEA
ncbi:MAG: 50S ribosomal protein L25/general stress protein Ctc [Dysgonamonadaceae bacterium]|jgi:large subunit ribosomal protein L25|nr:50S ribosomal protein L25/general stress protein Ctc [Dysgonamonadaceae bacterium]MDD3355857.1 50S ribosomal protein L25/general stress protein Ctc [Dysgonamonadaceae bacterium]MDD3727412.1 50S ribosomal protein L25/general stress protein Ctc [Dysgonamonadaceae bacterium]MDD4246533.1 50S ribosomal protein L25/general stress protein Ctc [Dysgonamonadaceae bacterium]MDD4606318.1 50S ribosomal protein L25/general stress protein Ctc [Dysgonamonadaceae bacterium]